MPDANDITPHASGRGARRGVLVLSGLVGLSALAGCGSAVFGTPKVWGLLAFEVVTLIASTLGIALGLGRPRDSAGLGVACVGATIFAAATLGRFSALVTRAAGAQSEGQVIGRLLRDPTFEGRVLASAALLFLACLLVLGNDRRLWNRLAIGAALGVPVAGILVWVVGPGKDWLLAPAEQGGVAGRIVIALVGGVALAAMLAASVHLVVGAFAAKLPPLAGARAGGARPAVRKKA
ncbi:MAG: hypothetical protein IPJ41_08780 [Phycisphaerales bacterium]|nr:hypothetical protein [Phycisphaerales bacterium]